MDTKLAYTILSGMGIAGCVILILFGHAFVSSDLVLGLMSTIIVGTGVGHALTPSSSPSSPVPTPAQPAQLPSSLPVPQVFPTYPTQ